MPQIIDGKIYDEYGVYLGVTTDASDGYGYLPPPSRTHILYFDEFWRVVNEFEVTRLPDGEMRGLPFFVDLKMPDTRMDADRERLRKEAIAFAESEIERDNPRLAHEFGNVHAVHKYSYLEKIFSAEYERTFADKVEFIEKAHMEALAYLDEHLRNPPALLDNIKTLGMASRRWEEQFDALSRDVSVTGEAWQTLLKHETRNIEDAHAAHYAVLEIDTFFADISGQYQEYLQKYWMSGNPLEDFHNLIDEHEPKYGMVLADSLSMAWDALQRTKSELEKSEQARPSWLENVLSRGAALKEWRDSCEALTAAVADSEERLSCVDNELYEYGKRGFSDASSKWVIEYVECLYPELTAAHDAAMERYWKSVDKSRLDNQKDGMRAGGHDGEHNNTAEMKR